MHASQKHTLLGRETLVCKNSTSRVSSIALGTELDTGGKDLRLPAILAANRLNKPWLGHWLPWRRRLAASLDGLSRTRIRMPVLASWSVQLFVHLTRHGQPRFSRFCGASPRLTPGVPTAWHRYSDGLGEFSWSTCPRLRALAWAKVRKFVAMARPLLV